MDTERMLAVAVVVAALVVTPLAAALAATPAAAVGAADTATGQAQAATGQTQATTGQAADGVSADTAATATGTPNGTATVTPTPNGTLTPLEPSDQAQGPVVLLLGVLVALIVLGIVAFRPAD